MDQQQAVPKKKKKKLRRYYDYSLLFTIIFLTVFGLIMIYSSSSYSAQIDGKPASHFMTRQMYIAMFSFVIMLGISKIDYHFYAKFHRVALWVAYGSMLLTNFTPLGISRNGKKRWLGYGSMTIQTAEIVKITVILVMAVMITKLGKKINEWKYWGVITIKILPLALLVTMNNLSSGIIICGIAIVMMFIANKRKWPFVLFIIAVALVIMFAPAVATALLDAGILEAYQLKRILVWQDPNAYSLEGGYQVLQGLYAIGSGGLLGKGLGQSIQKLSFLPEPQNDMIFAIICEELGLFGAIMVIFLFMFMIYRFMRIAGSAPDILGSFIVIGVMAHIAIQVILNIAVVTNTIPNTGITLPFISYGGTSVAFLMAEMGMVLGVSNSILLER